MASKNADANEVSKLVRSIIMSEKGGMEKDKFLSVYKSQEGSVFPYKRLGYESAYELLKSDAMKSVVNIRSVSGKIYLVPVVNDDVKHIAKLKQGEKDNKQTKNKPKYTPVYSGGGGGSGGSDGTSASTVEASCNYNSFSTFGPGVTKGGAYVQYELPPRFAKKSAEFHNNNNNNNGNNRNYNNYGNYTNYSNDNNNVTKKTPPPSSAASSSSGGDAKPAAAAAPPMPTTIVYEDGPIHKETVLKLVTLLEEKTGGLNTSTLATTFRRRWDGEELDFASSGFASLMDMLKFLVDDVVLQPMSGDAALAHSRKKVPQQLLEIFQASSKKSEAEAVKATTSATTVTADSGRSSVDDTAIISASSERNNNLYNSKASSIDSSSSSSPPKSNSSAGALATSPSGSQIPPQTKTGILVSDEEVMRQVKMIVQKVMDANPNGVMLTKMLGLFREASKGKELPYTRLGYVNPLSMFDGMKDLIRIERPIPYGDFLLLDVKRVIEMNKNAGEAGSAREDKVEDTAVILGNAVVPNGAASDVSSSTTSSGVAVAAASRGAADPLLIQPPFGNTSVVSVPSSTLSSAISPPSKSSTGASAVALKAAAMQAKIFTLKEMLVQVLKKLGPEGAPVEGIPAIFLKLTGKELIPTEFGYRCMTAMVDSFTDICQKRKVQVGLLHPYSVVVLSDSMSRLPIKDTHLLPEYLADYNGGSPLDPQQPQSTSRSAISASRNSSMSPNSNGVKRLPHDIAKEGDNYLAPEEMPLSIWIEIEIHNVVDPENIFFQVVNEDHEALDVLMHQLQEVYKDGIGDQYIMPTSMIKAETVCAAKFENDWHRAYIEGIDSPTSVNIFYVDYGTREVVDIKDLRLLKRRYLRLPFQARAGRLAGIRPYSLEEGWSPTSVAFVINFVRVNRYKAKRLAGMIVSSQDRTHNLYVADNSSSNKTRHLNDELVAACHAQAIDQPIATAAAVSSIKVNITANNIVEGDAYSGQVQLVFQGSRVFVFKIYTEALPTNIECISIGERLFVCRGLLSRLFWPEARTPISAALKQKPLTTHSDLLKTEQLLLANLPSLQNEAVRANLFSIKNPDGNLLAKLTVYPLEAVKVLATHFEIRSKTLLHTCVDDIQRAWKIGRLDHLVGNNVSPRTPLDGKPSSDGESKEANTNGHFVAQTYETLPVLDNDFPSLPAAAAAAASSSASMTPRNSKDSTRTSSPNSNSAAVTNSAAAAAAAAPIEEDIFISDDEDDLIMNIPTSSVDPILPASSIVADNLIPATSFINATSTIAAPNIAPAASHIAASNVAAASNDSANSVAALQRILETKQMEHRALLDEMMLPSDQSGTPLDQIMSKMTKLNVEMEDIKTRLNAFKPEVGAPKLAGAWGGMGGVGGGFGSAIGAGNIGADMSGVLGMNPGPGSLSPLSPSYIPAPPFFGQAPSSSLFLSNDSALFPSTNSFGAAPSTIPPTDSGSSFFPSANLLSNVDNLFSSFGSSNGVGVPNGGVGATNGAIGGINGAPNDVFGTTNGPFAPLSRSNSVKEDELGSLLRSPMLNDSTPIGFLGGSVGAVNNGMGINNGVGDFAAAPAVTRFNSMFGGVPFGGAGDGYVSRGFGAGNAFGGMMGDPLYGGIGDANFMGAPGVGAASPPAIGAEVSRSKFLPNIVAANRERNSELTRDEQEAKNIIDSFKNMNF